MPVTVEPLRRGHWDEVRRIHRLGIDTGLATFESAPPTWERFDAAKLPDQRWVAVDDGRVLGWAAAGPVSARAAYAGVVEHSVYVDPMASGRGIGRVLLETLVASTEAAGIWTIQAVVFPGNAASLALHERLGFRVVGRRERIARLTAGPEAGRWSDTLILERRSPVVGV